MYPFQDYSKWTKEDLIDELSRLKQVEFFYVINLIIKRKIGAYMLMCFALFGFTYNILYGETKYAYGILIGSLFGILFVNTMFYLDICIRKYRINNQLNKTYKL